jgi:hypothetical protein
VTSLFKEGPTRKQNDRLERELQQLEIAFVILLYFSCRKVSREPNWIGRNCLFFFCLKPWSIDKENAYFGVVCSTSDHAMKRTKVSVSTRVVGDVYY